VSKREKEKKKGIGQSHMLGADQKKWRLMTHHINTQRVGGGRAGRKKKGRGFLLTFPHGSPGEGESPARRNPCYKKNKTSVSATRKKKKKKRTWMKGFPGSKTWRGKVSAAGGRFPKEREEKKKGVPPHEPALETGVALPPFGTKACHEGGGGKKKSPGRQIQAR